MSSLRNIYFVNLSTADSWILPQIFDACKRVCLANGQVEQENCHFHGFDGNAREFSSRKGHSRAIDIKSNVSWLDCDRSHKKEKLWLHVLRENALLLYFYFRGFED